MVCVKVAVHQFRILLINTWNEKPVIFHTYIWRISDADFFELVDGVEKFAASEIAKLRVDFAKFTTEVNEKIENFGKRLSNQENRVEDIKAEVQSMIDTEETFST